eukprot:m.212586 g.212586  ORF g.212586 m.212586 type:complete len:54 (-) comp10754_c0_seq9:15-176(-)
MIETAVDLGNLVVEKISNEDGLESIFGFSIAELSMHTPLLTSNADQFSNKTSL